MKIGDKPFIIAEMSGNHAGSLLKALEIISAAKKCGCDAVKIQTYEPEDLNDPVNNHLYEESKIPREWMPHLFNAAKAIDIPLFSSVFSTRAIAFLEKFNCPAYKIASPESTRLSEETYRQLKYEIRWRSKLFLASSGQKDMSFMSELGPDVLFYCVAGYPAVVKDDDCEYLAKMNARVKGFSDHSLEVRTALAMIAAGATVIEKHFKIDEDCVDAAFSFNPLQMETLCRIAHR